MKPSMKPQCFLEMLKLKGTQILIRDPQARTKHHPVIASAKATNPAAITIRPFNMEASTQMMPNIRHNAPATPRAMRPERLKLGRKKLDMLYSNPCLRLWQVELCINAMRHTSPLRQ